MCNTNVQKNEIHDYTYVVHNKYNYTDCSTTLSVSSGEIASSLLFLEYRMKPIPERNKRVIN